MQTGYAGINDGTIYYETAGSGEPVIFVHGMGLNCHMWNDQFNTFKDNYKAICYDLRGFGRSSLPTTNYAHHTDLYALMQYLGIQRAHLIGLSMGGRVVMDFALIYPHMVHKLVLVDAAIHGYKTKHFSHAEVQVAAQEAGASGANRAWLAHELFAPARRIPAVAAKLAEIVGTYSGWHWLNKNPWDPIDPPVLEQLDKISVPSLVIVGEEDLPDFREMSDILYQRIPGAQQIVMHGVGHMSNMEDPDTFNSHVKAFLSAVAAHGA